MTIKFIHIHSQKKRKVYIYKYIKVDMNKIYVA